MTLFDILHKIGYYLLKLWCIYFKPVYVKENNKHSQPTLSFKWPLLGTPMNNFWRRHWVGGGLQNILPIKGESRLWGGLIQKKRLCCGHWRYKVSSMCFWIFVFKMVHWLDLYYKFFHSKWFLEIDIFTVCHWNKKKN